MHDNKSRIINIRERKKFKGIYILLHYWFFA